MENRWFQNDHIKQPTDNKLLWMFLQFLQFILKNS